MGQVKNAVTKRTPRDVKPTDMGFLETAEQLRDTLSVGCSIKDDDVLKEGDDQRAANLRKAGQLRAAYDLMTHVCALLENYS